MDECLLHQYPELEQSHFWWASRRDLIRHLLGARATEASEIDVLDVGCGAGVLAGELAASGFRVSATDLEPHPEWDSVDVTFSEGDYLQLSPSLGVHDVVLALDVMEHFEDDRAFVARLRENVRAGGTVIVTVPAYSWLWSQLDEINHHHRRYTKQSLERALTEADLEVDRCGYIFFGLIVPKLAVRFLDNVRNRQGVGTPVPMLNNAARSYFRLEHSVAAGRTDFMPAGTSVIAVCRRPG